MNQDSVNYYQQRIAELELVLEERQEQFEQLQKHHEFTQTALQQHQATLQRIYESEGWKLLDILYRIRDRVLPARIRPMLHRCKRLFRRRNCAADLDETERLYHRWIAMNEPTPIELQRQRKQRFPRSPTISIVVSVCNTPKPFLEAMMKSVQAQTYAKWELCLVDADSSSPYVWPTLQKYVRRDQRIQVRQLSQNEGSAANSIAAIAMAHGEWIGILNANDVLAPFALYELAATVNDRNDADLIYSDEDELDQSGQRCRACFKPDWSPETLGSMNYVGNFLVLHRDLLTTLGGLRPELDGAYDYDLVLRASEKARRVVHIPKVLYHRRQHASAAESEEIQNVNALDAGRRAVAEHFDRRGIQATIFDREMPGQHGARFQLTSKPLVSILIPNRDQPELLARCVRSLTRSTYRPFEILIIENGSSDPLTHKYYSSWQAEGLCRILAWDKQFHFAAMNNFAAAHANGELLLLLNNDVEALNADWLECMVGYAQQPEIGAVGAKLLFPNGLLQHGGLVLGLHGSAGHIGCGYFPDDPKLLGQMGYARNCATVTGACLLVRKALFEEVGGLDEHFPTDFNDTDFCLRLLDSGYRNVWTPDACLIHHESRTRGAPNTPEKRDRYRHDTTAFLAKWQHRIDAGDPYFSRHFRLDQKAYVLRITNEAEHAEN